jgi:hypothetical protein
MEMHSHLQFLLHAKAAQDAYPPGHRSSTIIRKLYKRNHEDQEPYQYLSSAFPKVRKSNKFGESAGLRICDLRNRYRCSPIILS